MERFVHALIAVEIFILATATRSGLSLVTECSCFSGDFDRPGNCAGPSYIEQCGPGTSYCFYRRQLRDNRPIVDRGCLSQTSPELVRQLCEEGLNNNDEEGWYCCTTDNCNDELIDFTLPAERIVRTSIPGTTPETPGNENNGTYVDPELVKIIAVGTFSVALGLIVLLILIMTCVIFHYRYKTIKAQNQHSRSGRSEHIQEADLSFDNTLTSRLSIAESEKEVASEFSALNQIKIQSAGGNQGQKLVYPEAEMSVNQTLRLSE